MMDTMRPCVWILLLLSLELMTQLRSLVSAHEDLAYVTVARCRVQCFKKFLNGTADDTGCWETNTRAKEPHRQCHACWDLCEKFMSSASLYKTGCRRKHLCDKGCQAVCDFIGKRPKAPPQEDRGVWKFPEDVRSESDNPYELMIEWRPPERTDDTTSASASAVSVGPIVYVLEARNVNRPKDVWKVVQQLTSTKIRIAMNALPFLPEFRLMAVSESGVLAQITFRTESLVFADIDDPTGPEFNKLWRSPEPGWYQDKYAFDGSPSSSSSSSSSASSGFSDDDGTLMSGRINATLSLSTEVIAETDGLGETLHTGRQRAVLKFRGPSWLAPDVRHFYSVRWLLIRCDNVYDDVPQCDLPRNDHASTVVAAGDEEATYTIKNLNYNSIYQMVIYLAEEFRVQAKLVFKTSRCRTPDALKLFHCLDEVPLDQRSKVPVKMVGQADYEPEVLRLSVNISSMSLQSGSDHVIVNVTWAPVLNQSVASYNVTTFTEEEGAKVALLTTAHPFIVLSLRQNTLYRVQVAADLAATPSDAPLEPVHIFDMLEFNTSDVNLAMYQTPQAFRSTDGREMQEVNGIIIGVICFVIVLVLALLTVAIYKKRNSFKGIIDNKATVAKSNSYKSNVGGKSDYSNQLVVFSDEWEMDPTLLKFSTLLGQGAFGKVVTGYYQDQKVAIKLVREGAPVSYKEDLVAEINLMKRIGSHPNIVCLIGACTISEPIALVMEYVPYGNLHNFLKKCRMEGDLRKRSDGPSEITYTVIQDSGGLECGVVTPADMLSFARQVAMAMEYLTEKKYVHRDLAARNVLIDHGKVVKVCDFGLSRDVFQDNHYKKLTNGKLPLKWMAIESLRDRIFTTYSDVWSFGILLWEIVTMGASPYPNVALADLYYVLSSGYRMDKPSNCSRQLYDIMRSCWEEEPQDRPNFTQLRLMLEDLLTEDRDYLVLEDIDVPISVSDNSSSPGPLSPQPLLQDTSGAAACSQHLPPQSSLHSPPPPPLSPLSQLSTQSYVASPRPPTANNTTIKLLPPPPKGPAKHAAVAAAVAVASGGGSQGSPLLHQQQQQLDQYQRRQQHFFGADDSMSSGSPSTTTTTAVVDHRRRSATCGSPLTPISPNTGAVLTTFSPNQRPTSAASAAGSAGSTSAASTSFTFPSSSGSPPDAFPGVNGYNNSSVVIAASPASTSSSNYSNYNNNTSRRSYTSGDRSNANANVSAASSRPGGGGAAATVPAASPPSLFPSYNTTSHGGQHTPTRSLSSSSSASSTSSLVPLSSPSHHSKQASPSKPGTVGPASTKYVKKGAPRRDHMRINVCTHQNSTDRLFRPSESDSSPSSC